MTVSVQIRNASEADVPAIVRLDRAATTAGHWSEQQYRQLFAAGVPQRLALILEVSGEIEGFLVARNAGGEWELENIVISTEKQRRGCASLLLQLFLDRTRRAGAESIHLEVRESNRPARALYEKWGFVETGRRRSYYSDPSEDDILYHHCFQQDHP